MSKDLVPTLPECREATKLGIEQPAVVLDGFTGHRRRDGTNLFEERPLRGLLLEPRF